MKRILLIGYGAMGSYVHAQIQASASDLEWTVLVKHEHCDELQSQLGMHVRVLRAVPENDLPDLVVECAGHEAVSQLIPLFLRKGVSAVVTSVGALSNAGTLKTIEAACEAGGSQVTLVSGALGGLDALSSASTSEMREVRYQGRKSPLSWKGTKAEILCDLAALKEATVFFRGTAREAAQMFPQNANVAAIVGLAGIGLDRTTVELIADPATARNTHTVSADGEFGTLEITISALPFKANPKTSALAGMSVVNTIMRKIRPVVI